MWILFASLNPISEGFRSLFIKKASNQVDPLFIALASHTVPVIVFTPVIFFIELQFNTQFWIGFLGSAIINLIASILYMKSIANGDISGVMPMLSFTPLFLLITGPLIIGEFPTAWGLAGILLVVTGSYLLNLNSNNKGILGPFKSLLVNKGTRYMLIVAVIWALSANFDKMSIQAASIAQHVIFVNVFIFTGMILVITFRKKWNLQKINSGRKNLLTVGTFTMLAYIFHMTALSLTLVAYVVAMKRMSGVISVILGSSYLKEKNIKERLLGATVMVVGVLVIVFS